jgi:hypothetical protein
VRSFAAFAILLAFTPFLHAQEATSSLTGTVRFTQANGGEMISDASVTLEPVSGGVRQEKQTDSRGSFRFSELPAGTYILSIARIGFDGTKLKADLLANEQRSLPPIALTLAPSGCFSPSDANPERTQFLSAGLSFGGLAGRVKNDLGPVVGARVLLSCWIERGCSSPKAAITDSQGDFEFQNVRPGRYILNIALDKFFPVSMRFAIPGGIESSYSFDLTPCPNGDCTIKPSQSRVILITCE